MSEQMTLALSRATDPATSHAAGRSVNMKDRKREVLSAMERLSGPCTATEIQADMARTGILRESGTIRSRLSQLESDGLTVKVGERLGAAGRWVTLWRLA